jgi:hypothetical protein
VTQRRRSLDVLRHVVAVLARHADVGEHNVGWRRHELGDGLIAVADGDDGHVLVGKRQLDDALNRGAVVGQEQGVRHVSVIGSSDFELQTSYVRVARPGCGRWR